MYRDIYRVKAVWCEDDETVLHGYLQMRFGLVPHICEPTLTNNEFLEVDRSTICRCTGIPILGTESYLYEYDLITFAAPFLENEEKYGYIDFDDYCNSYVVRLSANSSIYTSIKKCLRFKVVGNVILYKDDMPRFQAYSDNREQPS